MTRKIWNWQQKNWPDFSYTKDILKTEETAFLTQSGLSFGIARHIDDAEKQNITISMISNEAYKTSEIEGEILNRDSLQSSIKQHFGYKAHPSHDHPRESGIAEMIIDLHHHYDALLSHDILHTWHEMLMNGRRDLNAIGRYRSHEEPMQVVSDYVQNRKIHFEAPPSSSMMKEMSSFIAWFNHTSPTGKTPLPPIIRASIAHLRFLSIHPFEDGNGRIGRALVEKVLAQHLKQPTLIGLSQIIQDNKKRYYDALEIQNKHNEINGWLEYFAEVILEAQKYTISEMDFLIQKAKFFIRHKDQMNARQNKVIARMYAEGTKGFEGGLSAQNYITISQTSPSTATRDLKNLVDKNALTQTGKRKATRYWLRL
jgi:Fic family protein